VIVSRASAAQASVADFRAWLRRAAGRIAKEGDDSRALLPLLALLWLYRN